MLKSPVFHIFSICIVCIFTSTNAIANPSNQRAQTIINQSLEQTNNTSTFVYKPGQGVLWHTNNGEFSALMNYLLQLDGTWSSNAPGFNNASNIPLSKFYLSGNLQRLQYTFTYNFANMTLNQANIGLDWNHFNAHVGQIDPYFGLLNDVSDNAYEFISPAMIVAAFSPNYAQGMAAQGYGNHWVDEISLFGQGSSDPSHKTATLNATMRILYVPIHKNRNILHFGIDGWTQTVGGNHQTQFFSQPQLQSPTVYSLVNTQTINNTSNYQILDTELVVQRGPFNIQSEYTNTWVNRFGNSPSLQFNGYYVLASYFFTGESRIYQFPGGYFTGITPIRHRLGALQLLAGYSFINLNDNNISGGAEHNTSLGLNWYMTKVAELSINYIHANANLTYTGTQQLSNFYVARLQINF